MENRRMKIAIIAAWVIAITSIAIKEIQEERRMKTLLVPIEVTDAQYLALDKIAKDNAQDEAQLVATAAVIGHANHVLETIEKMTNDIHAADRIAEKAEEMPRTQGFVNAEVADVEAAMLYEEIQAEENIGQLTASGGVFMGPSGKEKYYNLPMETVISMMRSLGYSETEYPFWIRDDDVKMFGRFVMIAADTNVRPKGTILDTSLGEGIVVDHCVAAELEPGLIDIAVFW